VNDSREEGAGPTLEESGTPLPETRALVEPPTPRNRAERRKAQRMQRKHGDGRTRVSTR
jgi:hypothetical protein